MSIRAISRHKRTSKSFLNQPIQYRQVILNRNSHQAVNPSESYSITPKSRTRQFQNSESKLQKLLSKSPATLTPLQKSKQMVFQSTQKQRKALSKNDSNNMGSLKRTLTTSIKAFKQDIPSSYERMNTICTQKINKHQQKLQLKQIKLQQSKSQLKRPYTIDEINQKLQNLVTRKLKLVMKETQKHNGMNSSILNIMKESIDQELMNLIQTIRNVQNNISGTELQLLNQKIYFIQTLLAEQTTQRELMKKYYYKLTSNKKKGKIGDFNHFKMSISDIYKEINSLQRQKKHFQKNNQSRAKPVIEASINRQAYKKPNLSDYESYRYKQKNFAPNLQPLPRSSYKRQFLYLKSSPDEKIVKKDHSPYNPFSKAPVTSIYDNDYKSIKTEIVDHKQLDAYKNKIKVLKVNYMPKNKFESVYIDRQSYIKDVQASTRAKSPQTLAHRTSQNEINYNRHIFKSEAHRSFMADQIYERSQIKHQQLKQFQYRLKKMFKA